MQQANEGRGSGQHLRAQETDRLLVWGRDGRAIVHFPNFIRPRLRLVYSGTVPSGSPRAHRARVLLPFPAGTGGGMALIVQWVMPARKNGTSALRHSRFTATGVRGFAVGNFTAEGVAAVGQPPNTFRPSALRRSPNTPVHGRGRPTEHAMTSVATDPPWRTAAAAATGRQPISPRSASPTIHHDGWQWPRKLISSRACHGPSAD